MTKNTINTAAYAQSMMHKNCINALTVMILPDLARKPAMIAERQSNRALGQAHAISLMCARLFLWLLTWHHGPHVQTEAQYLDVEIGRTLYVIAALGSADGTLPLDSPARASRKHPSRQIFLSNVPCPRPQIWLPVSHAALLGKTDHFARQIHRG